MATEAAVLKALSEISEKVSVIDDRLKNFATKDDISNIRIELKQNVKDNADKIRGLENHLLNHKILLEGQISQVLEKKNCDTQV